jgi:hypothetical protein
VGENAQKVVRLSTLLSLMGLGVPRADDYSARQPGPAVSYLYDICRASLVCTGEEQILAATEELLEGQAGVAVLRLKNR